jgi:hypothetical protein
MRKDLKLIGAAMERRAILRKARALYLEAKLNPPAHPAPAWLWSLIEWILDRDKRYNKRLGGLGK